jgi:phenylalanine-4-hydroxylase
MKQNYTNYTREDHNVWSLLFERQLNNLNQKACSDYLRGLLLLRTELHGNAIPDFERLNALLASLTGWSIEVVPGLIEVDEFFHLLARRKFPSSTWLRKRDQLDYLEEPDMFHDVFGHIPMLAIKGYADFMQQFGKRGVEHPAEVLALQRLYWYTVEFGLVREQGQLKIFGAGLASSFGETNAALCEGSKALFAFELEKVMATGFFTDRHQDFYFVLSETNELFTSFGEYQLTRPCSV